MGVRVGFALAHIERFRDAFVHIRRGAAVDQAVAYDPAADRVMGQNDILGKSKLRDRAMSDPFLRHEGSVAPAPFGNVFMAAARPGQFHHTGSRAERFSGNGIE